MLESLASVLLLLLVVALALAFMRGGPREIGAWFHSKFIGAWMPAVGIVLILIGLWLVVRTLAGNPSLPAVLSRGKVG